jgi:tetratricopeptide (TPR) repeat protein/predicted Ser/Thr protein kinase
MDLAPGTRIASFEVRAVLGRGGMGVVYDALDHRLERPVALKLARARSGDRRAASRLLAEARALARLTHPNVVTVYEVGELPEEAGVYIAMEQVRGRTLRRWLEEAAPSRDDVLAVLRASGEGLRAAHGSGLVHRDFKPDNVLIADDGRARVSDFGLAQLAERGDREGSGSGTFRYMAPEQLRAEPVDARADQFAVAAVAYEALAGHPAFEGDDRADRARAISRGAPPRPRSIPPRLYAALCRALAASPDERYPDLGPVLDDLARATSPRRDRRWGGALAGAVVAAGGALAVLGSGSDPCAAATAPLDEVWPGALRAEIASHGPGRDSAWREAVARLDDYARRWREVRKSTCGQRFDEGRADEARYLAQTLCLRDAARAFGAVARVLADGAAGTDVLLGPSRLSDPAQCARARLGVARWPMPEAPAETAVRGARDLVARARALEDGARYAHGLRVAREAEARARSLGFEPAVAEAEHQVGRLQTRLGRYEAAAQTLESAYLRARRVAHDALAAQVAGGLAYLHGFHLSAVDEAKRWADLALADVGRLDDEGPEEARVLMDTGTAYAWAGDGERALAQHRRALALVEAHRPDGHLDEGGARARLGATLARFEDAAAGLDQLRRAIDIFEARLGPDHPELVRPLTKLGLTLAAGEAPAAGVEHLRRALTLSRDGLGEQHALTGLAWMNLGVGLYHLGRIEAAVAPYRRAREVLRAALGPEHPDVALVATNLGLTLGDAGRHEEALEVHRQSLRDHERSFGRDNPAVLPPIINLTHALLLVGRFEAARPLAERALALAQAGRPGALPFIHHHLGEVHLASGAEEAARAHFQASLRQRRAEGAPPRYLAESLFGVARASDQGRRARATAREALALLDELDGDRFDEQREEIRRFIERLERGPVETAGAAPR